MRTFTFICQSVLRVSLPIFQGIPSSLPHSGKNNDIVFIYIDEQQDEPEDPEDVDENTEEDEVYDSNGGKNDDTDGALNSDDAYDKAKFVQWRQNV